MQMNETDLQNAVLKKKSRINPSEPVKSLRQFLKVRPVGIRKLQVINEDIKNFQFIISKLTSNHVNDLLSLFTESECEILLDYLHRFMRFVGEQKDNISSGNALSIEQQILKKWGPCIIIQAASRDDSINFKVRNNFGF